VLVAASILLVKVATQRPILCLMDDRDSDLNILTVADVLERKGTASSSLS
jgi:hypothetical protein